MNNEQLCSEGWLETFTHKRFYVLNPRPEDIDIKPALRKPSRCNAGLMDIAIGFIL